MAKKTKEQRLASVHMEALYEFDKIQDVLKDERQQCLDDRRFYSIAGAMWEGKLGEQFENKPKFEINKIHLSVIRIFNEYRNNRITVDFIPKDGTKDPIADTCDGLYRATEEDSSAEEAYDNAFEEAVGGGFGAFRLRSEYEDEYDEDNEQQRILIEPIYDADTSVFFDLNAKKYDKSDSQYCFVLSAFTRDSFIEEWGEDPASWPKDLTETTEFDWSTPDVVYVAEYYRVEEVFEKIFIYETLDGVEEKYKQEDFDNNEKLQETLDAIGTTFVRERKIKQRRVHKYIMSGNKVLEDCGYIAGREIPIVPVYGKRWFIDNVERCMGHVRLAKDSQRLYNMQSSKLGEISALSTVEKPIMTPEQVVGHQLMWEEDNIKDYPYLLINPIKDMNGNEQALPPVSYTKVPNVPPAMAALLQLTNADMKEILGNQEAGEEITPNISGKAIELVQNRLDMQTFIYMSNMSKSIKRSGEIWLSMASEIFVEEGRKIKYIEKQGGMSSIELMRPKMNPDTAEIEYENDLSKANLDVSVEVGPSSSSKRSSTVRSLTGMLQFASDPETQQVLTSMIMMNMEGEGVEDVRKYFRNKMVRLGVIKPNEEETKELASELENQQPDANTQYLQAAAMKEEAEAAKNRADTILTISKSKETQARTEEIKAKTMETLSGIESEEQQRAISAAQALGNLVNENPGKLTPE